MQMSKLPIAGEGVEYMRACAKGTYRNLALKEKKGKSIFTASVRTCLSAEVIAGAQIRKFSRQACQYMLAYHVLDSSANLNLEPGSRLPG